MQDNVVNLSRLRQAAQGYQAALVEGRECLVRARIALLMVRHFCVAYDSDAVFEAIQDWVDGGMQRGVRWPACPLFAAWAARQGLANVGGCVSWGTRGEPSGQDPSEATALAA